MNEILTRHDVWLAEESPHAAIVMHQWYEPAEGKDAVIFPPTYAKPEDLPRDREWIGYNIDVFPDGSNVCQLDSVGSQANRMEPIFKRPRYRNLVPQVSIHATVGGEDRVIDILDAGHRAADAVVRFSTLGPELHAGYSALLKRGDIEPLVRIAPTSVVFGSWDSRATQVKLPRIVRSVLRAYNVDVLHRSAQYATIAGEILDEGDAETTTSGPKPELGLAHVPAPLAHGGIRVKGEIRRDVSLNLEVLRAAAPSGHDGMGLLRYLLGLALVAITAPPATTLREGCQLVPDAKHSPQWRIVRHDGTSDTVVLDHADVLAYATAAAEAFGVKDHTPGRFRPDLARKVLQLTLKDAKKLLRSGAVTDEAVEAALKAAKKAKKSDKGEGDD